MSHLQWNSSETDARAKNAAGGTGRTSQTNEWQRKAANSKRLTLKLTARKLDLSKLNYGYSYPRTWQVRRGTVSTFLSRIRTIIGQRILGFRVTVNTLSY